MPVAYLSSGSKPQAISTRPEMILSGLQESTANGSISKLPVRQLVTARRLDLAVKYRFFRHLYGGDDPEAVELYRWHIWKRSGARMQAALATDVNKRGIDDYLAAAVWLYQSMGMDGFDPNHPVPVDPDGELLNGSHRVACALALGIASIPVEQSARRVWAPAWNAEWFRTNGMDEEMIAALEASLRQLRESGTRS